jgi:hypothetical protein
VVSHQGANVVKKGLPRGQGGPDYQLAGVVAEGEVAVVVGLPAVAGDRYLAPVDL